MHAVPLVGLAVLAAPAACFMVSTLLAVAVALHLRPTQAINAAQLLGDGRTLFVVAHPDDECMFFSPLLARLGSARPGSKSQAYILCLSKGNAYGLGGTREQELYKSAACLGVPRQRVTVIDDPCLQDGFHTWDTAAVAAHVAREVERVGATQVVTFDQRGVSGHPNHTSTWHGVRLYLSQAHARGGASRGAQGSGVKGYQLETVGPVRKFTGALEALLAWGHHLLGSAQGRHAFSGDSERRASHRLVVVSEAPWQGAGAMVRHWSQLVWYRLLFLCFSRYTFINTFTPFDTTPSTL